MDPPGHARASFNGSGDFLGMGCGRAIFDRVVIDIEGAIFGARIMHKQKLAEALANAPFCKVPGFIGWTWIGASWRTVLQQPAKLVEIFLGEVDGCAISDQS